MAQIVGLGGLVYDFLCKVDTMPTVGETKMVNEMKTNLGGKSANSVVQASLLGNVSTAVIGKVGADEYGREQLDNLRSYNVDVDRVKISKQKHTSLAFVTIDNTGRNQIILASGADQLVTEADIVECTDLLSQCKVLISNFEIPMDACVKALSIARQHRVTTILVPAPVPANYTVHMLPEVDILCPNEVEAAHILNMKIDDIKEAEMAIDKFFELGKIRWPMITMGEKGVMVGIRRGQIKVIPPPTVKVVDTTGAGDSFVGSLAFQLVKNPKLSIDDMITRAVFVASMSTTSSGTRPSYISGAAMS